MQETLLQTFMFKFFYVDSSWIHKYILTLKPEHVDYCKE
jgi:hypothetical protein